MLYWIVVIMVISLLVVGIYMDEMGIYSLYFWYKLFGFVIFFVILVRVIWCIKNGWLVFVS